MIAWELAGAGVEQLRKVERGDPEPGPGQILVRVRAVSLNHRDLSLARRGVEEPIIPASDGAGEVLAIGPGVKAWRPGDRVVANFFQTWIGGAWHPRHAASALGGSVDGMLAELLVVEEGAVVAIPDGWSFEEAATLPCAGVTAWNALFGAVPLRPGELVVVQGTGGVSVFALQLAAAAGAEVAVTSSSDEKLAVVAGMGASVGVNYRTTPNWAAAIRSGAGRGADHVVEVTGQLDASLEVVASNGSIAVVGTTLGTEAPVVEIHPGVILQKGATIRGIYVGSTAMLADLIQAMVTSDIRPVIDRTFAFDETPQAYRAMMSAGHIGKIVIAA